MPFIKITKGKNKGKYITPNKRIYTLKQVRAYYATGGWKRPVLSPAEIEKPHQQKRHKEKV